ncbi:MAG: insulinase family protein [Roseivirga sp.]
MKKLKLLIPMLLAVLILAPTQALAFQNQELPVNPDVKIGKLDNGFTYYIHANPKPENRVEFRLAVNAGSILEDEDQLGLAHFTEHMLFNGTENFKKNELIDFLQKMGLEFGGDLNAYTSFDETVYILPIPLEDPENLDKALRVLSDWSHKASMEDEEINKERGVVLEEWRLGRGAGQRMREATWPIAFKGSLYAERLPIGTEKSLENFKTKAIKRFYKDWYRPDLMALVAVGDFDAEEMEAKIKEYFSDWKMPKKPRERVYTEFPDFKETRVAIATDAEATGNSISVNFMTPGKQEPKADMESFRKSLVRGLFSQMINQRLDEKRQAQNPPFLFSYSGYGSSLPRNKNEYTIGVNVKDGEFAGGLKAAVTENERVRRYGFTAGELERVKAAYLNSYDRAAKEADKRESWRIVNSYVGHFLRNSSIMSPQQRLDLATSMLPGIKVEEINTLIKGWMGDQGQYIVVNAKEENKGDIPSEEAIKAILRDVRNDDSIKPYAEKAIATSLLAKTPAKGKVTSEETNTTTGITKMTLSNGATVYAKSTDFKNDELRMTAFSEGGHSLYSDEDFYAASYGAQIVGSSGLGDMSAIDMRKFMTGKTANVRTYVGAYEEGMSGFSSLKDMETFFQLVYKNFTDVRRDEEAFESWRSRTKNQLANFMSSPDLSYQIELQKILTDNHPRGVGFPSSEDLDNLNLDRSLEIYKERFADAGDFTFVFVGNIDMATFKPMVETYIGSLPGINSNEQAKDLKIRPPRGQINENIYAGVDKKSSVSITLSGDYDYDLQDNANMSAAASILTNKMIETLREEMGGVYGAGARASTSKEPWESFNFSISFPCDPDNVDALVEAAMAELEKVKAGDFTDEDLEKVLSARVNNFDEQIKNNGYWERMIGAYLKSDLDLEEILKANERNKAITKEQIVAVVNKYLTKENMIKVVKLPEEYKKGDLNQEIKKN